MVRICLFLLLTVIAQVKAQTASYQLRFSTSVATQFNMIGADVPDTTLKGTLEGILKLKVVVKDKNSTLYSCSFDTLKKVDFPLSGLQLEVMYSYLKKGFAFRQLKNGGIDSIYLHPEISDATESVIMQFLECYQANLPEKRQSAWKSTITLSDGTADAYWSGSTEQANSKNVARTIRITKLEEHRDTDPAGVQMLYRYTAYNTDLCWSFSADNTLQHLEGFLNRKAKVNHKTMTRLDNTILLNLIKSDTKKEKIKTPEIQSYTYIRTLNDTGKLKERDRAEQINRSKRFSINMLLQGIAANQIKKDENLRDMLVENIQLSFLTEKDSLWLFKQALMNAQPDSLDFRTLRAGIASSSTPYAQTVIAEYLTRHIQDPMRLKRMIPSAGLIKNAGPILQLALEKIAYSNNPNASAAKLALGNIAGSIKKTNPSRADSIADKLAKSLVSYDDDFLLLSVLGNCGVETMFPYIQPYLKDSVAALRGYACYALRFLGGPNIDKIFLHALTTEKDEDAQQHIFNGLFFRKPDQAMINYIYQLVITENNEKVGLAALRLLFQWSYNQPDLLNLIYESSQKGATEELRKMAAELYANTDEGAVARK